MSDKKGPKLTPYGGRMKREKWMAANPNLFNLYGCFLIHQLYIQLIHLK
jgi:hypothetical protein